MKVFIAFNQNNNKKLKLGVVQSASLIRLISSTSGLSATLLTCRVLPRKSQTNHLFIYGIIPKYLFAVHALFLGLFHQMIQDMISGS